MNRILLFLALLLSSVSFSQESEKVDTAIVRASFYFQGATNSFSPETRVLIDNLLKGKKKGRLQLIELNTFCGEFRNIEKNIRTAQERISVLLDDLEMSNTPLSTISIENFGNEKPKVNFTPKNWNRIDVYYTFHSYQAYNSTFVASKSDTFKLKLTPKVEKVETPEEEEKVEEKKEVKLNIPSVIPIQFKPNKAKLISSSTVHLDELYQTLIDNPNISALIRGHVCCAPNFKMSKKRAKVVYKYLLKKGVPAERISFRGYSNAMPVVFPERTERDRERNRRVDVVFKKMN